VEQLIWLLMPLAVAFGSALITYLLMRDKVQIAVAEERQQTVEARALLEAQKEAFEERLIALRDLARCQAQLEFAVARSAINTEPKLLE
jgi:DNA mismatch repair ATPase MutS